MCENFRLYLEVELLDHQLWNVSTFQDNFKLFSKVDVVTDPILAMNKSSCGRLLIFWSYSVYSLCELLSCDGFN